MLITAARARDLLPGLTGTTEDTLLETLIGHVDEQCARRCGYPEASPGAPPSMESRVYTLDLRASDPRELDLEVYPATGITSAAVDSAGDFEGDEDTVPSADMVLRDGRRLRLVSTSAFAWSSSAGSNRITVTAGYNGRSSVTGAHAANATTITVASTAAFGTSKSGGGRVMVGTEVITFSAKTATTLTGCTRGAEGTTAASMLDAAVISQPTPPGLAQLVAQLVKYFYELRTNQQIASLTVNGRTTALQDTARGERDLLPDWALAGLGAYLLPSAVL